MNFHYMIAPIFMALGGIFIAWVSFRRILSSRTRSFSVARKTGERVALSLVGMAALALAGSSAINAVAFARFRHASPGKIFEVNGRGMRLDCTGSGSPTIVLEAGLGNDGLIWGGMQPVLSETTRVCSYDRAGYGWSDTASPPRDADHIAAQLHTLLAAAGIDEPVVLMGHSIAGIYIRDYATRYSGDVAGLIFVDGSTPLQEKDPAFEAHLPTRSPGLIQVLFTEAAFSAGIPRWHGTCVHPPAWPDPQAASLMVEDRCYPGIAESLGESRNWDRSGEETEHSGPYGALPILIFSHDPAKAHAMNLPGDVENAWDRMQQNLLSLSTRSHRIIARGSGHNIQLERPELLEKEVALFIKQIRGTAPQPANYGTTVTE
jgi:pimeloyl-ACP methyl ester carboxylesterase